MTKVGVTFRILVLAGAAAGGWWAAPFWQKQPSARSALRLLFRPAAASGDPQAGGILTFKGCTVSMADLRDTASLRAMLTRVREAAPSATPQEAEGFLIGLLEQFSALPPEDLRSLALDLAKDRDLLKLMDETSRAVSLRLLSQDLARHLFLAQAQVVRRDPDRMLLLAEALPPSKTRDDFLGTTLSILALDRPAEVLALLGAKDAPVKDPKIIVSALHLLASRSFEEALAVWNGFQDPWTRRVGREALNARINDEPDKVFAWIATQPEKERAQATAEALQSANPDTSLNWLKKNGGAEIGGPGYLVACSRLAKSDPSGALDWLLKLPDAGKSSETAWNLSWVMADIPLSELLSRIPGMSAERQSLLLGSALQGRGRPVEELVRASEGVGDSARLESLGAAWAQGHDGDIATTMREAESLPPGRMREAAIKKLSFRWGLSQPEEFGEWLRAAPREDQNAAMAGAVSRIWQDPKNAALARSRPPVEQLPFAAMIYRDDATAAAAVIERASNEGADGEALDKAAKALAQSWQDRDPATARAFALSLPDPRMADSVLLDLAARSARSEARAAAVASIQDPVTRQQAERAAALKTIGIDGRDIGNALLKQGIREVIKK